MKLYARRTSSNSQKVLWFLGELDVEYEFVPTGGDAGGLDRPEYRAMNPNGAVPTLLHLRRTFNSSQFGLNALPLR